MELLHARFCRNHELSAEEHVRINELVDRYNNDSEVKGLVESGGGESFRIKGAEGQDGAVLEAFAVLPVDLFPDDIDDFIFVFEHWLDLLTEMRLSLNGGDWEVRFGDEVVGWDVNTRQYVHPR